MHNEEPEITKNLLDKILKDLGKEYRKKVGKQMPTKIVLVGGAAVLANYGFRNGTNDMDAIIFAASSLKDAMISVRDKYDLKNGWLNSDFISTSSFSPKIVEFSKHYKTFANTLEVRTVAGEYLIAMKLCSGRFYKHDMSDIVGVLLEHEQMGMPITYEKIDKAVCDLYGSWDTIPTASKMFIESTLSKHFSPELYSQMYDEETAIRANVIKNTDGNSIDEDRISHTPYHKETQMMLDEQLICDAINDEFADIALSDQTANQELIDEIASDPDLKETLSHEPFYHELNRDESEPAPDPAHNTDIDIEH